MRILAATDLTTRLLSKVSVLSSSAYIQFVIIYDYFSVENLPENVGVAQSTKELLNADKPMTESMPHTLPIEVRVLIHSSEDRMKLRYIFQR